LRSGFASAVPERAGEGSAAPPLGRAADLRGRGYAADRALA
jgi:hypothetical protein